MHMQDTSFIHVCTEYQVTMKDKGDAYDKAMKLVLSCILDYLPTEPRTTHSALQQVYTSQHLSALILYLVQCSQAKRLERKKARRKAGKD
jgi:hypothetical protein